MGQGAAGQQQKPTQQQVLNPAHQTQGKFGKPLQGTASQK